MGLMNRLSTLARADAHGVVDALEDRTLMLRQHLREAGAEVVRKRCRLEAMEAESRSLEAEDQRLEESITELDGDVQLALAEDKEDLARFSIKKLIPIRQRRRQIGSRREELRQDYLEMNEALRSQQAEYETLEQRVKGFLAHQEQGNPNHFVESEWMVSDEDVELELLRRKQATEGEA